MQTPASLLRYLDRLLLARVQVTETHFVRFPAGTLQPAGTVVAPKVLLMLSGSIDYELADHTFELAPGVMFYRPARTVARWRVREACEFLWCEFESTVALNEAVVTPAQDTELERASLERIRILHARDTSVSKLEAEGELKAVLARFVRTAADRLSESGASFVHVGAPGEGATRSERAVRQAVTWLADHLAEPGAMRGLHERVGISRDHFRRAFTRQVGMSARRYLTHLRMRSARFYLRRSDLAVKEVAAAVGYVDPLYFSRHYRAFHGHPPGEEHLHRV